MYIIKKYKKKFNNISKRYLMNSFCVEISWRIPFWTSPELWTSTANTASTETSSAFRNSTVFRWSQINCGRNFEGTRIGWLNALEDFDLQVHSYALLLLENIRNLRIITNLVYRNILYDTRLFLDISGYLVVLVAAISNINARECYSILYTNLINVMNSHTDIK